MKILYFAALKESLGLADELIEMPAAISAGELKTMLIKKHGKQHFASNILCAVNQKIANDKTELNNNDEVAFYPPVTGG